MCSFSPSTSTLSMKFAGWLGQGCVSDMFYEKSEGARVQLIHRSSGKHLKLANLRKVCWWAEQTRKPVPNHLITGTRLSLHSQTPRGCASCFSPNTLRLRLDFLLVFVSMRNTRQNVGSFAPFNVCYTWSLAITFFWFLPCTAGTVDALQRDCTKGAHNSTLPISPGNTAGDAFEDYRHWTVCFHGQRTRRTHYTSHDEIVYRPNTQLSFSFNLPHSSKSINHTSNVIFPYTRPLATTNCFTSKKSSKYISISINIRTPILACTTENILFNELSD